MNQHGDVQAVGGVNDKIEGFFDVCARRGLTGTQGVVIPRANVHDLMLREDVVEACAAGKFSIYAIDRIEQGVELADRVARGRRSGATGGSRRARSTRRSRRHRQARGRREHGAGTSRRPAGSARGSPP